MPATHILIFSALCSAVLAFYMAPIPNLGADFKYNGTGFTKEMQDSYHESIDDAAIFFNGNYEAQAWYIKARLQKIKAGTWHVFITTDLNISKISDVSTNFYYWSFNQTWALWYASSSFQPLSLHLALYDGPDKRKSSNVTTEQSAKGAGVSPDLANVISSIVGTLDSTQDIAKYIQKYDGRKWSVLSYLLFSNNLYPRTYAALDSDDIWITYKGNVTMQSKNYSQILYV